MSNPLVRGIRAALGGAPPHIRNDTTVATLAAAGYPMGDSVTSSTATNAMKLSAVNRCIEVLSDSIGKLPVYVIDRKTRERVDHWLDDLLTIRPNEAQTPTEMKKMVEANVECTGNGYIWISRDPATLRPRELIPVPGELVTPWLDTEGHVWYSVIQPFTGEPMTVHRMDMVHIMGYSHNGWQGISTLRRASETIGAARAAQQYNLNYYVNGGQPAGVLQTATDLSGEVTATINGEAVKVSKKELLRREWEKRHAGPANAARIAILDYGLEYKPIAVSNRDAQFVEQTELSVQDIARFFGVPLYKLQAGKQSYSSNEQNAIEYVVGTLHPKVTTYEEEFVWKLLPRSEAKNYRVRMNMMAELRGDYNSRGTWYRVMREIGAYSVNDIRALEDMSDVDGGDDRYASLNYVPLAAWERLSENRNQGGENNQTDTKRNGSRG